MLNRPHGKKMGIIILIALIIISLAEVIFRSVTMGLESMSTSNFGEQLAVIVLAVTILILTAKGKDRACYICYGAWIGYFVLDQFFEIPGFIIPFITIWANGGEAEVIGVVVTFLYVISMLGIIGMGALLVEYMNDGTIYNRAFNILWLITVLAISLTFIGDIYTIFFTEDKKELCLAVFHNLYRLTMVFLFYFFAYDSAKMELAKLKK